MIKIFGRSLSLPVKLLMIALGVVFLHYVGVLGPVEYLASRLLAPVQSRLYGAGSFVNGLYRGPGSSATGADAEAYKALQLENATLKAQLDELKALQQQIVFLTAAQLPAIAARVIGKSLQPDFQTLIIDKGARDGLAPGMPVISGQGIMVGKIIEARDGTAHVLLLNDSHSSVAVTIQNETRTKGLAVGDRGLSLKMELIPRDTTLAIGDMVVTSGLEPTVPRGLVVGQVEHIVSEQNDLFQQAFLKPLVDLDHLLVVSVITTVTNQPTQ